VSKRDIDEVSLEIWGLLSLALSSNVRQASSALEQVKVLLLRCSPEERRRLYLRLKEFREED